MRGSSGPGTHEWLLSGYYLWAPKAVGESTGSMASSASGVAEPEPLHQHEERHNTAYQQDEGASALDPRSSDEDIAHITKCL